MPMAMYTFNGKMAMYTFKWVLNGCVKWVFSHCLKSVNFGDDNGHPFKMLNGCLGENRKKKRHHRGVEIQRDWNKPLQQSVATCGQPSNGDRTSEVFCATTAAQVRAGHAAVASLRKNR